jgi:hypothetical protein
MPSIWSNPANVAFPLVAGKSSGREQQTPTVFLGAQSACTTTGTSAANAPPFDFFNLLLLSQKAV